MDAQTNAFYSTIQVIQTLAQVNKTSIFALLMSRYITLHNKQFRPYITQRKMGDAVKKIASKINKELKNETPLFLVVLNGSFMFASDLLKQITIPCEISFIKLASYTGTGSSGQVTELIGLTEELDNRTVIIVEDIIDSGLTIEKLVDKLKHRQVKKLKIATALFKHKTYKKQIPIDYIGIRIPNDFVVGYGMDYNGLGRNLKQIHVLVKT